MAEALVRLIIRADGIPELQKTAEAFKKVSQAIKGTEKDLTDLDRQFRRGVHAPTFGPGWQGQAGGRIGATIGAGVGVAGGALLGAIKAHPLLTIAGGLFAARGAIRAFGEEEMTLARTEALLRAQGIEDMSLAERTARVMSEKTLPAYRQQMEAIGSLLLITNDYKRSLGDLSIVNDIAAVTGWDLNTASLAYGRALEGDMLLMGKYVYKLKEMTEEQKKNQGLVRATIAGAVSGQAEAQAQTPTGQLAQARKEIAEAMQVVGGALTTSLAVPARGLLSFMKGPESLFDLEGLRESNRVESEAFRRRFFPEQSRAEHLFTKRRETDEFIERTERFKALLSQARNDMEAQVTIMGRIRELQSAIAAESGKEGANFEVVKKALHEIKDLEEKRKKLQQEIAGIAVGPQLGRIGRVGALTGAVAGLGGEPETRVMTPEGPRWIPASGKHALMERFGGMRLAPGLTLGQALHEREGITGFDVFRQEQLGNLSLREDLPTSLRVQAAGELFQNQLGMLSRATTPEMQAQMFGGAVQAMGLSQRLEETKASEDRKAREDLIGAVRAGNASLSTLVEILRGKTSAPAEVNFHNS